MQQQRLSTLSVLLRLSEISPDSVEDTRKQSQEMLKNFSRHFPEQDKKPGIFSHLLRDAFSVSDDFRGGVHDDAVRLAIRAVCLQRSVSLQQMGAADDVRSALEIRDSRFLAFAESKYPDVMCWGCGGASCGDHLARKKEENAGGASYLPVYS